MTFGFLTNTSTTLNCKIQYQYLQIHTQKKKKKNYVLDDGRRHLTSLLYLAIFFVDGSTRRTGPVLAQAVD